MRAVGPETDFAGAIYGQVLASSAVVALSRHGESPAEVAAGVAATVLVFWAAHVYAEAISRSVVREGPRPAGALRRLAAHEWPIVQAAVPAVLALLLSAAGLWSLQAAIVIALVLGVAELAGWGLAIGRRTGRSPGEALLIGLACGAFGVAIIVLKALIH